MQSGREAAEQLVIFFAPSILYYTLRYPSYPPIEVLIFIFCIFAQFIVKFLPPPLPAGRLSLSPSRSLPDALFLADESEPTWATRA